MYNDGHTLMNTRAILPAKKLYFWLGDEEEVPTQKLGQFLRGEKPNVAHPTAAWASQSGKGLLFFAKHADDKSSPSHIINLVRNWSHRSLTEVFLTPIVSCSRPTLPILPK